MTYDATDDYVTCRTCGMVRPVTVEACPRCARERSLLIERFGIAPKRLRIRRRGRRAGGKA